MDSIRITERQSGLLVQWRDPHSRSIRRKSFQTRDDADLFVRDLTARREGQAADVTRRIDDLQTMIRRTVGNVLHDECEHIVRADPSSGIGQLMDSLTTDLATLTAPLVRQ